MYFADQLYPPTDLPAWLDPLWSSPEVQRLRQVRLVNAASPTIASLSDVRRFSHLLGVAALAARTERSVVEVAGGDGFRNLLAAAVLHDIGTPAFGHLFEYCLNAQTGWSHEAMILEILHGRYSRSAMHEQIYAGRRPSVATELERLEIDPSEVDQLTRGVGPLGSLLAGALDIDNIDNVFRMASHLGLDDGSVRPLDLVNALGVDEEGQLIDESGIPAIKAWRRLRRRAYERMVFDPGCLSAQAMLTHALAEAIRDGELHEENWDLTDEQLVHRLSRHDAVRRFAVGDFYAPVFLGWFDGEARDDLRRPDCAVQLTEELESALEYPCRAYVYYDRGTFEKKLELRVRTSLGDVTPYLLGSRSNSTVVSVVTPRREAVRPNRDRRAIQEVLSGFGLSADTLKTIPERRGSSGVHQTRLPV